MTEWVGLGLGFGRDACHGEVSFPMRLPTHGTRHMANFDKGLILQQ